MLITFHDITIRGVEGVQPMPSNPDPSSDRFLLISYSKICEVTDPRQKYRVGATDYENLLWSTVSLRKPKPFQTSQAKWLPFSRPNWNENHTLTGEGTYSLSQLKGVPPSHPFRSGLS